MFSTSLSHGRKGSQGFTLVELMIVIAIIGVLAAALFPSLSSYQSRARDTQRKSDFQQIVQALEVYHTDMGKYPDNGTDTTTTTDCIYGYPTCVDPGCWGGWDAGNDMIDSTGSFLLPLETGGYISRVPREKFQALVTTNGSASSDSRCTYRYQKATYSIWTFSLLVFKLENMKPRTVDEKPYYAPPTWGEGGTGSTHYVQYMLQ